MAPEATTRRQLLTTTGALTLGTLAGCTGGGRVSKKWDTSITNLYSQNSGDYDHYYAEGYAANQTQTTYKTVSVHIGFYKENDERIEVVESEEVYDVGPDHQVEFTVVSGPYDEYATFKHPDHVQIHHVEADK